MAPLEKIELECPNTMTPKQYATFWIRNNGNSKFTLIKVNNTQAIARNHINNINREYYYLFKNSHHVLGHLPGMDELYEQNSFDKLIFRAQVKKLRPKRLKRILAVQEQLNGGESW